MAKSNTNTSNAATLEAALYNVEKNVAVPARTTRRGFFWRDLAQKLQHGECTLVRTYNERNALGIALKKASNASSVARRDNGTGLIRVWKIVPGLRVKYANE